jgi:hypothetical protein
VQWIKRFILFHNKRHPKDIGADEVTQFLSALAVNHRVAGSTQNQALSAILFLYQEVPKQAIPWLDDVVREKVQKAPRRPDPGRGQIHIELFITRLWPIRLLAEG